MGERAAKRSLFGDHSLPHLTMYELERFLEDVESSFDLLDRAHVVWEQIVADDPRCADCAKSATHRTIEQLDSLYIYQPDDAAVVACLASRHRSLLSQ